MTYQRVSQPAIVIGARSRAAVALRQRLPRETWTGVTRTPGTDAIVSDQYLSVPPTLNFTNAIVVNCVGSDRGSPADLHAVNVEAARTWAEAALAGGCACFVHISSFSVFQPTTLAHAGSPLGPQSAYGQSKLAAEQALMALDPTGRRIRIVRVPILVSPAGHPGPPDKLARLIGLIRRLRAVPRPHPDVARSMLSYQGLAKAILLAADRPKPIMHAADPQLFTYALVDQLARAANLPFRRLPVPRWAGAVLSATVPALHQRLLQSMALSPQDNLFTRPLATGSLPDVIRSHLAGRAPDGA